MYQQIKDRALTIIAKRLAPETIKGNVSASIRDGFVSHDFQQVEIVTESDRCGLGFTFTVRATVTNEVIGSFFSEYCALEGVREKLLNRPSRDAIPEEVNEIALNKDGEWLGYVNAVWDSELDQWIDGSNEDGRAVLLSQATFPAGQSPVDVLETARS